MCPIFEFFCEKCEQVIEEFVENREITDITCPICKEKANKILSSSNWNIKGTCYNHLPPKEEKTNEATKIKSKVLYTLYCPNCEHEIEDFAHPDEDPTQECEKCGNVMKKKIGGNRFELKYNPKTDFCDWEGNTSRYWSAVKKQRQEGKNVKGKGEI